MSAVKDIKRHYLIMTHPSWGHLRALITLSSFLVGIASDLHITMIVLGRRAEQVQAEQKRYCLTEEQLNRINKVYCGEGPISGDSAITSMEMAIESLAGLHEAFAKLYPMILDHSPLPTSISNQPIILPADLPDPSLIIFDLAVAPGLDPFSAAGAAWIYFNGTACEEGYRLAWDDHKAGRDLAEACDEHHSGNTKVVEVPDIEPVYMYEMTPTGGIPVLVTVYADQKEARERYDGLIIPWPGELSRGSIEESRKTYKHFFTVGPMLPLENSSQGTIEEYGMTGFGDEVTSFLDKMLSAYGEKSVLYISFGTFLFPPNDEQVIILMDMLVECKVPFLIVQGHATPKMVEAMNAGVARSEGRGMVAVWARQHAVLGHKSISFFLTHCGQNSVQESLSLGVPMICWPGAADQPVIANELTRRHGVAWELYQVRRGPNVGKKTLQGVFVEGTEKAIRDEMRDVFGRRMRGVEGEALRSKVNEMKEGVMRTTREPGGMSFESLHQMATAF